MTKSAFPKFIKKSAPFVVGLYFFIGLLAYLNAFPGSSSLFKVTSISGILFRAFTTLLLVAYCFVYFLLNRNAIRFPTKWIVFAGAVLGLNLIAMFSHGHSYHYLYVANLYERLHEVTISVGWNTLLPMYLSSISDFALAICFVFLLPYAFSEKKQLLWLLLPMVGLMVFECGYSLIVERAKYVEIFSDMSMAYSGYNVSIGATFGDKQEFGSFLTVGFCCALLSFYIFTSKKRSLRIAVKTIIAFAATLFFVQSFLVLCKTAILSNCLALLCVFVAFLIFVFQKSKITFSLIALVTVVGIAFITLVLTVDQFHQDGVFALVYKLVNSFFLDRVNNGVFSRFFLVSRFFRNLDPLTFLFGLSKGGVNAYMNVATRTQEGLHTGFVYFQACYGLFGSFFYFALFLIVIRNLVLITKENCLLGLILLASFVCSCVFNLAECEVLIVSGSAPIFLFNMICVVFPKGFLLNEKRIRD